MLNPLGLNVKSATDGIRLTAAERKEKALELRKMGHSFFEIGKAIGVSLARAHAIVTEYLKELAAKSNNTCEELRTLELEKCDATEVRLHQERMDTQAQFQAMMTPNGQVPPIITPAYMLAFLKYKESLLKSEDSLLKVRQHRAKLLGLVTPTQVLVPVDSSSQKGRVEMVSTDPHLLEVVDGAKSWQPPRLAIAEPPPDSPAESLSTVDGEVVREVG